MQKAEYPEVDPDIADKQDTLVVHFDDRSLTKELPGLEEARQAMEEFLRRQ